MEGGEIWNQAAIGVGGPPDADFPGRMLAPPTLRRLFEVSVRFRASGFDDVNEARKSLPEPAHPFDIRRQTGRGGFGRASIDGAPLIHDMASLLNRRGAKTGRLGHEFDLQA